ATCFLDGTYQFLLVSVRAIYIGSTASFRTLAEQKMLQLREALGQVLLRQFSTPRFLEQFLCHLGRHELTFDLVVENVDQVQFVDERLPAHLGVTLVTPPLAPLSTP